MLSYAKWKKNYHGNDEKTTDIFKNNIHIDIQMFKLLYFVLPTIWVN